MQEKNKPMKKFFILFLLILFFYSCQKSDKIQNFHQDYTAVLMNQDSKGRMYTFSFAAGHQAAGCNGCVTILGKSYHVDCMGAGSECAKSSIVSLIQTGYNNYTATTLDSTALTNEDFFNMPSRSLFVEYDEKNNEVWLNIPAQLVFRDSTTQQFTFTGLYYSNSAVYAND